MTGKVTPLCFTVIPFPYWRERERQSYFELIKATKSKLQLLSSMGFIRNVLH